MALTPGVAAWTEDAAPKTAASAPTMGQINRYNATAGALVVTLPALAGLNVGARTMVQKYTLDVSANTITFNRAGSDVFDDASTALILGGSGESRTLQVVTVGGVKKWKITEEMGAASSGGGGGGGSYQPLDADLTALATLPGPATKLSAAVTGVTVSTGSETRPANSDIVVWVGGATQPTNIAADDVWLQDDPTYPAGVAFIPGWFYRLNPFDPAASQYNMVANQVVGNIFIAGRTTVLTDIAVKALAAGSAGSVIRFGLFELNGSAATLVSDFGTATSTATGVITKSGAAPIEAGKRYLATVASQGGPTTRPNLQQASVALAMWGIDAGYDIAIGGGTSLFTTGVTYKITGGASGALASGVIEPAGDGIPAMVGRCAT
jgi:hypothetical protein